MKFNHRDWDIDTDVEMGNDDFIYGNYVEWDRFRYEREEDLLDYFDVELPWGKSLTLQEYTAITSQEIFKNLNLIKEFLENGLLTEDTNGLIKFIERNNKISDKLISSIFDYYGVPSGTEYEYDLPEYLRYWESDFDYNDYKKYPIKVDRYEETINQIFDDIYYNKNELVKKSLILSSLIITESMFKSVIVEKIPEDNEISEFGKEILQREINKILRGNVDGKNTLFKKLYKEKAPEQNWINLRNSLAHDIEGSEITKNEITYLNLKTDRRETYFLTNLKKDLIDFCKEIKRIINN